jgi:hypothetical protein
MLHSFGYSYNLRKIGDEELPSLGTDYQNQLQKGSEDGGVPAAESGEAGRGGEGGEGDEGGGLKKDA